jgi:Tol biopolymer transport system component
MGAGSLTQAVRVFGCDVYLQELDGAYAPQGSPRRITHQEILIEGIAWSHDSIIYGGSLAWGALYHLWRVKLPDGVPDRIELAGAQASSPAVAAAGNRLAFTRSSRNYDIMQYKIGGSVTPLIKSTLDDLGPQFSPDGRKIAFSSTRSGDSFDIWIADADGSNTVQLTHALGRAEASPRWSPDGKWIAFDSLQRGGQQQVFVVEATGGLPRQISEGAYVNAIPSWSRDGNWIYFFSDRTGRDEIWRVPFSGGHAEQVTTNGGHTVVESADGKTLFYTKRGRAPSPLFARPVEGGPERRLLDSVFLGRQFSVFDDGIYYLGDLQPQGCPLFFFRFATGTKRFITYLDGAGLTVSPDRRTVLFEKDVASGADLMLIENFR